MICELNQDKLFALVNHQINNFWPLDRIAEGYMRSMEVALKRIEQNFIKRSSRAFQRNGEAVFNIRHSVQYSIFLYTFANQLYLDGNENAATTVYYLNKIMHSVDWFYEINMPEHFGAEHPLSSVVGRAKIGDYLFLYQGTTIGGNRRKEVISYPIIGEHVLMYSNSKILGESNVGNNVILAANSYVLNEEIPDNSIVFGQSPDLCIKRREEKEILERMQSIWIMGGGGKNIVDNIF